jgi:hypothetical protein
MELIKYTINPRQQVLVLYGNIIQSTVIHTPLLSNILLQDENHSSSPWVELWQM